MTDQQLWDLAYKHCDGSQDKANQLYEALKTNYDKTIYELNILSSDAYHALGDKQEAEGNH